MGPANDNLDAMATAEAGRHSTLASLALGLSVFAFVLPFGITAVVLGHVSRRQIATTRGAGNGGAMALAALIIAYTQMALTVGAVLILWQGFHVTIQDFRGDAMVQRVLREPDANQPPDYETAREEENTARTLLTQIAGIEAEYHRESKRGYLCTIPDLIQAGGTEGATPAEKRAFAERFRQSRYVFEIQGCTAEDTVDVPAQYKLAAVPHWPQTANRSGTWCADGKGAFTRTCSPIFCADQTGEVRQVYGGTSADCFDHGHSVQ
jgi:hypothetical protein